MTDDPIDGPDLTAWAGLLDDMRAETRRNPSTQAPQPTRNPPRAKARPHAAEVTVPRHHWPAAHTDLTRYGHDHTAHVHPTEHAVIVNTTTLDGADTLRRYTQESETP